MAACREIIMDKTVFGSNDVRGIYPEQLNEADAYNVGRAFCVVIKPHTIAVGRDVRLSSDSLKEAIVRGILDSGVNVLDIGQCGTEMVYFATFSMNLSGGIMITASHNPKEYNGIKFVREKAMPISCDNGLFEIRDIIGKKKFRRFSDSQGHYEQIDISGKYVQHLLSYVDTEIIKPFKIIANVGNGSAGAVLEMLEKCLPCQFIKVFNEPDGNFPNGVPNPLLRENRKITSDFVCKYGADLGIAWDGDFDRCFLFDERGVFIEGAYMVALLARAFLEKYQGEKIICDDRVNWNIIDICRSTGGEAIVSKSGHSFIKAAMRRENAVYGGEMSAHHYFRDFSYCDSGMLPWLLIVELLSNTGMNLSQLLEAMIKRYPCSGEINMKITGRHDADEILRAIEKEYVCGGSIRKLDGLSVEYPAWRFNVRKSNTEPLLRINAEARNDVNLLQYEVNILVKFIEKLLI